MGLVTQFGVRRTDAHGRGIWIGPADPEVGRPLAGPRDEGAVLAARPRDPVAPSGVPIQEPGLFGARQRRGRRRRPSLRRYGGSGGVPEEAAQVVLNQVPGGEAVQVGVGLHLGRVEEQLIAAHQPCLDAEADDLLEEAAEHREAETVARARQVGVVGQRLVEVVAEVPAHREAVGRHPHELSLAPHALEEHDELQFEEDYGVDARATALGVQRPHHLPNEREVQLRPQSSVEIVVRDEVLKRDVAGQRGEGADLKAHHGGGASRLAVQGAHATGVRRNARPEDGRTPGFAGLIATIWPVF